MNERRPRGASSNTDIAGRRTHAATINWRGSGAVGDLFAAHTELAVSLSRMNGASFWAFSLWRIPEGELWPDNDMSPKEFLQSSGNAQLMTLELREIDSEGAPRQFVVGRPHTAQAGPAAIPVTWRQTRCVFVHAGEDFTAEQAAPVFISYYETGRVPAGYSLRELDLTVS
ncbi:hypothetical protein [uncultured Microbacterium sp.]|uniref:hypothetical protein n=1 Tax=uncultured Microbacterium sp. TaxID=191216 RepID=UPI0025D71EF1|nr:hypothetical protein [uncultured Microbacterium sp.]